MTKDKEGPEGRRERLRQEELTRNPAGAIHGGGLQDLVGGSRLERNRNTHSFTNRGHHNLFSFLQLKKIVVFAEMCKNCYDRFTIKL